MGCGASGNRAVQIKNMKRDVNEKNVFNEGTKVEQDGTYVCAPCGYTCTFKKGGVFPHCFACLEGKKYEGDSYMKGLGLWELLE
jgi:transposase-like protein